MANWWKWTIKIKGELSYDWFKNKLLWNENKKIIKVMNDNEEVEVEIEVINIGQKDEFITVWTKSFEDEWYWMFIENFTGWYDKNENITYIFCKSRNWLPTYPTYLLSLTKLVDIVSLQNSCIEEWSLFYIDNVLTNEKDDVDMFSRDLSNEIREYMERTVWKKITKENYWNIKQFSKNDIMKIRNKLADKYEMDKEMFYDIMSSYNIYEWLEIYFN